MRGSAPRKDGTLVGAKNSDRIVELVIMICAFEELVYEGYLYNIESLNNHH